MDRTDRPQAARYDGQGEPDLALRLGVPRLVLLETTTSTLDVAHELGAHGAPNGALVLADEQTAGRGRRGRSWFSPRGGGIWLTMLLRPGAMPTVGALSIRAGLAAVDALTAVAPGLAPQLKWPNDLMVKGRKAGGILCEARWNGDALGWVAVGVGINVKGPLAPDVRDIAVALDEVLLTVDRESVLRELVPRLAGIAETGGDLTEEERGHFLRAAWRPAGGEKLEGIAPDGALLVRRPNGSLDRRIEPA